MTRELVQSGPYLMISILADSGIKATLLFIVAFVACLAMRKASAAIRHQIWSLAFCGTLLLPLGSAFIPQWRIPVLPFGAVPSGVSATVAAVPATIDTRLSESSKKMTDIEPPTAIAVPTDVAESRTNQEFVATAEVSVGQINELPTKAELLEAQSANHADASAPVLAGTGSKVLESLVGPISLLWLIGFLFVIAPVVSGTAWLRRLVSTARRMTDSQAAELVRDHTLRLGLVRPVTLVETSDCVVPMTFGVLRPLVMLPFDWRNWTETRLRFVLLHELAHIHRLDVLHQVIGRIACAVHWFNLLAWFAFYRLQIEREFACDDCVVTVAETASAYANELIEIAQAYRSPRLAVGIAITRSSALEQRIVSMFDAGRSHLPVSRSMTVMLGALTLLIVMTLSFVTLGQSVSAAPEPAAKFDGQQIDDVKVADQKAADKSVDPADNRTGPTSKELSQDNDQSTNAPAASANANQSQGPDASKPVNASNDDAKVADEIVFTGIVVKPDGSPAAQATIRSMARVPDQLESQPGPKPTPKMYQATADAEGRFSISINRAPYGKAPALGAGWQDVWKRTPVVASLKGFGFAYVEAEDFNSDQPVKMSLEPDHPIRGQIVDLEGTPVAGTTIQVRRVQMSPQKNLDRFISFLNEAPVANLDQPSRFFLRRPAGLLEIDGRLLGLPEEFRTDKEGRFEVYGLGKEQVVHLAVASDDLASRSTIIMTREMEPIKLKTAPGSSASPQILGSNFKLVVAPSRSIEGTVVDADTGEPLPGVAILSVDPAENRRRKTNVVTDQSGHFRLPQMAKGARVGLFFVPADDQPYFMAVKNLSDSPGVEPVELNVKLHRGIWIKGRITNKLTHEPVPGIAVHYYPFKTNKRAEVVYFELNMLASSEDARSKTDADGMYRIVGLSGPGLVEARSRFQQYRTGLGFKELNMDNDDEKGQWPIVNTPNGPQNNITSAVQAIDLPNDEMEVRQDFELDPGVSARLRFVDAKGELVKGTVVWGRNQRMGRNSREADGNALVEHLGPDEKRTLFAHHTDRELGLRFQIEPPYDQNREITVVLEPLAIVTGRLLEDGQPIVKPGINFTCRTNREILPESNGTDSEGRFRLKLIPGQPWELLANRRNGFFRVVVASDLNVRAGETIDLGDLQLENNRFTPVKPKVPADKPEANDKPQQ